MYLMISVDRVNITVLPKISVSQKTSDGRQSAVLQGTKGWVQVFCTRKERSSELLKSISSCVVFSREETDNARKHPIAPG